MNDLRILENYYVNVQSWVQNVDVVNESIEASKLYPVGLLIKTLQFENFESFLMNDIVLDCINMIKKQLGSDTILKGENGKYYLTGNQLVNFIWVFTCLKRRSNLL